MRKENTILHLFTPAKVWVTFQAGNLARDTMVRMEMEIHENNREHLNDFIRLNEEWISKYFSIEQTDRDLAANPGRVIEEGGYIFSLVTDGKVVGVCALFNKGEGVYELARMAVSPQYQGRGYGRALIQACLDKVRQIKARRVYLVSNTKLKRAIALYRKSGFVTVQIGQHPVYSRGDIVMELRNTEQSRSG